MKIEKINYVFLTAGFGLVVFIGTLISYGSLGLDHYINNEFVLAIPILFIAALHDGKSICIFSKKKAWCLLMFVAIASEIINDRIHVLNLYSMLFFVLVAIRLREQTYRIMLCATIVAQFVFFYLYGLESFFNSYALTTAVSGIEILLLLYNTQRCRLWHYLVIFLAFFVVLFTMESRTALLAFAIGSFVLILGSIKRMKKNKYITLCMLVLLGLVLLWKYYDLLYGLFFNKWNNLGYGTIDITSGRFTMWKDIVLNQKSLLGHSESFISEKYAHQDLHNVFIQVLGKYGLICFFVFIIWFFDLVGRVVKLSAKYRLMFLSFFSFYFVAGIAENVLFLDCKVFMITFCFYVNLAWLYKESDQERNAKIS